MKIKEKDILYEFGSDYNEEELYELEPSWKSLYKTIRDNGVTITFQTSLIRRIFYLAKYRVIFHRSSQTNVEEIVNVEEPKEFTRSQLRKCLLFFLGFYHHRKYDKEGVDHWMNVIMPKLLEARLNITQQEVEEQQLETSKQYSTLFSQKICWKENEAKKLCQQILWDYIKGSSDLKGSNIRNGLNTLWKNSSEINIDSWFEIQKERIS